MNLWSDEWQNYRSDALSAGCLHSPWNGIIQNMSKQSLSDSYLLFFSLPSVHSKVGNSPHHSAVLGRAMLLRSSLMWTISRDPERLSAIQNEYKPLLER